MIKRHGIKGEVKAHLETGLPKKLESIFLLLEGRLVPFFIESISAMPSAAILKLEDVNTPSQAGNLAGKEIFISREIKTKPKEKAFEMARFIGLQVFEKGISIGEVINIHDHEMNPLVIVQNGPKEILIPINDYFVKKLDLEKKEIWVELPEGFLDI